MAAHSLPQRRWVEDGGWGEVGEGGRAETGVGGGRWRVWRGWGLVLRGLAVELQPLLRVPAGQSEVMETTSYKDRIEKQRT